ncbi:MAG: type II toxin-antitoxin system VapC family toxin [Roseitalea porphyridii]|jgi:ribonuclease VapC|uniref:type II toxin-antitoxin system VapC family toxin n=1 Tax=Roseitalea porphyridii TaxID=1852022 RepID=UPI0032ED2767
MVVDSSAIVAIATQEPEAEAFSVALAEKAPKLMSMVTYFETASVLMQKKPMNGLSFVEGIVRETLIELIGFEHDQLRMAIEARRVYGRGTGHPAQLNFGDCFSCALARTRNMPLLFKGDDFVHTHIASALPAG